MPLVALDNTFGALFIGVVVAAILYGFTCVQTWYYFAHYPLDSWYIKLLVVVVLILDTCHQALITHAVYTYTITYFGEFEELEKIVWSMIAQVLLNAFTTLFVQSFLAVRVHKLSNRNWFATGSVMVLVIAEFLVTTVYTIRGVPLHTYARLPPLKPLLISINVLAAAGDVLIAALLCHMLHTSRTGFLRSDNMINKLMVFSINTGLLTSLWAIASLASILAWFEAFIYVALYFCIGRLYCNTLLATLNARKALSSDSHSEDVSLSFQSRSLQRKTNHATLGASSKCMPNNISIKIDTTQEYISDEQCASLNGDTKTLDVD